jgi:hypothetical protein
MKTINKVVCGGLLLGVIAASVPSVHAGDREWATAGKILTGVAIANVLHSVLAPSCESTTTYVYSSQPVVVQPAVVQQVVYVQQPAQVVVLQPVPVYQPQVVQVIQPVPVFVYQPAPVIIRSGPVIYGRYGGNHGDRYDRYDRSPRGRGPGRW